MEEGSGLFSTTDLPKPIASLGIVSLIAKFSERRKGSKDNAHPHPPYTHILVWLP